MLHLNSTKNIGGTMIMKCWICVLICCLVLLVSKCSAKSELEALCRDEPLELSRISQVVSLIELATTSASECNSKLIDALWDLEPILSKDLDDVCSLEKAVQIVNFHKKYISTKSSWLSRKTSSILPESLKRFVLAFGLKVSSICKQSMLSLLSVDPQSQLTSKDYGSFRANAGSLLSILSSKLNDYDDIVLVGEIVRPKSSNLDNKKLYVLTSMNKQAKRIQASCERRFKPFYERLILPNAILSTAGYGLKNKQLEQELEEMRRNEEVNRWYEITLLCESLAKVETFEPDEQNSDKISILNEDEADKLRQRQEDVEDMEEKFGIQLSYRPATGNPIEDLIINKDDVNLMEQIDKFDIRKKTMKRLRRRALQRTASLMKKVLLTNHKVSILGGIFKSRKQYEKEGIISAVDEFVQKESGDGKVEEKSKATSTKVVQSLIYIITWLGIGAFLIVMLFVVLPDVWAYFG